jgi:hypothetical protein
VGSLTGKDTVPPWARWERFCGQARGAVEVGAVRFGGAAEGRRLRKGAQRASLGVLVGFTAWSAWSWLCQSLFQR